VTKTHSIGKRVLRLEDGPLIRGHGRFVDDLKFAGMLQAAFVRSPHAHAGIRGIDCGTARRLSGVHAVLTFADIAPLLAQERLPLQFRTDQLPQDVAPFVLAKDEVVFVGEAIAVVIAQSRALAEDAAALVEVDYEPLPAVAHATEALKPGAPQLWDNVPDNLCVDCEVGDEKATAAAFARAAHVVRLDTWIQRVTGVTMETRTSVGEYDPATGLYTLHAGTGSGVSKEKLDLAHMLGVPLDQVRCFCQDMGGNFGTRNFFFPEYALIVWAAKRLGHPVKWTCERREAFLSDYQGRDLAVEAELALDHEGNFLAIRGSNISNLGAHAAAFVSLRKGLGLMSGVYHIPVGYFRGRGVVTNTVSTTPYRSAGRPEAIFVMERLVDLAAQQCGFDPVDLRRRNMIPPEAQPYSNPLGLTYDNGRYAEAMDIALRLADRPGFAARRAEAKKRGKLRGFGVSNYIEITSGAPRERTEITVLPEGKVELLMGTMSSGQGHETSFAQLVTEWLGVPFESIGYVAHDTARVKGGGGSHSGRSMKMATIVIGIATDEIVEKGRKIASHLLEAGEIDIEFSRGRFRVAGTDREIGIFEVAAAAATRKDLPRELQGPLAATSDETIPLASYPYGTQICEVEVDPETGMVDLVRFAAVDDVGRAVNPLILHGQTHGGIAQGVGQALWEDAHYDPKSAQLLAATFMDYAMPRADTLPSFATELSEVPAPSNRLGVRSGGEGGTTPALAVVINAIVDALSEYGVRHIEMPATSERVWRAMHAAGRQRAAS